MLVYPINNFAVLPQICPFNTFIRGNALSKIILKNFNIQIISQQNRCLVAFLSFLSSKL